MTKAKIKSLSIDNARPFNIILSITDSSTWSIDSKQLNVNRIKSNDEFYDCIRSFHNPDILYSGKNFISRSLNNGKKWEIISDHIQNIKSIEESLLKFGLLYVVDSSNIVYYTENSGYTWKKLDSTFDYVLPSRHKINNVYAVKNSSLLVSNDYGINWKIMYNNLSSPFIIIEDPSNPNLLYTLINNEPHISYDYGSTFNRINNSLQNANYKGMVIHPKDNKLIALTDSLIYIIDINSFQQITPKVFATGLNILDISKKSDELNCYYFSKENEKVTIKIMYKDEIIYEEDIISKKGLNNYLYNYIYNKRKNYLVNLTKQRRAVVTDKILPGKYLFVIESDERKVGKEFYIK